MNRKYVPKTRLSAGRPAAVVFLSVFLIFLAACPQAGFPRLGEKLDLFSFEMGENTQSYLYRAAETSVVYNLDEDNGLFARMKFAKAGSVEIVAGDYSTEGSRISLKIKIKSENSVYDTGGTLIQQVSETEDLTWDESDPSAPVIDGNSYQEIGALIDRLDISQPDSQKAIASLYNFTQLSSHAKVRGFGSEAMAAYVTKATFAGFLPGGEFSVHIEDVTNEITRMGYRGYADIRGLVFNGSMITDTENLGNSGTTSSDMSFTLTGAGGGKINVTVSGSIAIANKLPTDDSENSFRATKNSQTETWDYTSAELNKNLIIDPSL